MAYIDQKAAVDAVKKVIGNLDHECKPMMDFYSALWNVPAADVAPVVRCGECKHAYINSFSAAAERALCLRFTNITDGIQVVMDSDDFCSYGDRR